jgi:aminoglycoside phosphotransferase (APT) family kinase protein
MLSTSAVRAGSANPIGALIGAETGGGKQRLELGSRFSIAKDGATSVIPDDSALPALQEIRIKGLANAIPALQIQEETVEFLVRRHRPGSRITLEARAGQQRFVVKASSKDPAPEAEIYAALANAGLANDSEVRVPPLLAWDRDLRALVTGWLDGPTALQLIENGQGARAGELAARWLRRAAALPAQLRPPVGDARRLDQARKCAVALDEVDLAVGTAAAALAGILARTQPAASASHLVHGSFHARHLLDLGNGVGVLDWRKAGQGPLELDAGTFLAELWRLGLVREPLASEAVRAIKTFLAETGRLLDERALAWHRAAMLVRFACRETRGEGDWRARAHALLGEAWRLADAAG